MIRIDIRKKRFEHHAVLGPIAFDIAAGETVALTGPSGIGKTTLLRLVAGIDPDFEGQIVRPDRLAIVFQDPTLLPWRSAIDNLTLIHGDLSQAEADAALTDVGLDGKGDLFPGQLSLGQQRRLSLARAFAGIQPIYQENGDGMSLVHLAQGGAVIIPNGEPKHWRAALNFNGYLVGLALYSEKGGVASGGTGKALLIEFAEAVLAANVRAGVE
mgnify:CR=1 FL=1